MALRRMNSEVNDSFLPLPSQRESRRYVHLGREASPLLPWIGSPEEEPCDLDGGPGGGMDELFDFGFASGGAEHDGRDGEEGTVMDEIDMAEVERRLDGAIAGFDAVPTSEEDRRRSSVWEDGERYWESQVPRVEVAESSPLPVKNMGTPRKGDGLDSARRSIQMTPKSLYDSDGFLRT